MPQAIPALIGVVAKGIAANYVGTTAAAVIGVVAAGASAYAMSRSSGNYNSPATYVRGAAGISANKESNEAPIPVIYGSRGKVGGIKIFKQVSGTDNKYLHIVMALCEGPISAINTVYLDDVPTTDARFSGLVVVNKWVGTDDQAADPLLVSLVPEWTTDHRLRGVAYVYVQLTYNASAFNREPVITADIDGKLVYDLRDSTTKFSTNPVLCIRDYLASTRYGRALSTSLIDSASSIEEANYCDENVTIDGVTQKRYECNGVVNTADRVFDNVKALMTSCRGMLIYSGGTYKIKIDKPTTTISTSSSMPASTNLIGHWKLDEGSGITAVDSSGAGHDGSVVGSPSWVTGVSGQALSLDSDSLQYVNIGANTAFNTYNVPFSICAWVYPTVDSQYFAIGTYYGNKGFMLGRTWGFTIGEGSVNKAITECSPPLNQWSFLVGTFDGTHMRAYLNGVQVGSAVAVTPASWAGQAFMFGRYGGSSGDGYIDDVRFYTEALTADNIWAMYMGIATFEFNSSNITGAWQINLGSKTSKLNRMVAKFYNPDRNWQPDLHPIDSATYRTEDNNLLLEREINLPFTANYLTAGQIATIELKQTRQPITASFTAFMEGIRCEVGDVVYITHPTPGWSQKLFRVMNISILNSYEVRVQVREYDIDVYDYSEVTDTDTTPDTYLPDVFTVLGPSTITALNVSGGSGAIFSGGQLRIQYTVPVNSPNYDHTEIWVSKDNVTYYRAATDDRGDVMVNGLGIYWDYGDTVYVKLVNVNQAGVPSSWPSSPTSSTTIDAVVKISSFYAGPYDLWGGNASIAHADTKIVLGGLEGTPKIALGGTADSITLANAATYPGVYFDGNGYFRAGGAAGSVVWNGTKLAVTGEITATTGAIANFTIAANSLTSTLMGIHSAGYAEGAEILLGHATAYASAKIGLKADGSGKLASGNLSWDTSGNITSTGNISLTAGYLRAGTASDYTALTAAGILGVSSTLGTTVNIPSDGSAPTFSSGTIKEFAHEIYTSGVIRTNANPAANGGMILNNIEMKGYNSSGMLLYRSVWDGTDEGDFYAGNYAGGAAGISYDHSAGTMAIDADIRIRAGHDIYLYGDNSNPGTINFIGSSYQTEIGINTTGNIFSLSPTSAGNINLKLGNDTYAFNEIWLRSKSLLSLRSDYNYDNYRMSAIYTIATDAYSKIEISVGNPTALPFGGYIGAFLDTTNKAFYPASDYREIPTLGSSTYGWQGLHLAGNGGVTQAFINATTTDLNLQISGTTYATLTNSMFSTKGDITINSDLGDVTSKVIFGRTAGGNAEINYNGSNILLTKKFSINARTGSTQDLFIYADTDPIFALETGASDVDHIGIDGKALYFRYKTSGDYSEIGAYQNGVGGKSLFLNPLGGGVGIGATSFIGSEKLRVNGQIYADGNVSADSFTDRTPFYEGDALSEIMKIKGKDGKLDHSTLPAFTYRQMVKKLAEGVGEIEEGRDIGAMLSMVTVGEQQLYREVIELRAMVQQLEKRIAQRA